MRIIISFRARLMPFAFAGQNIPGVFSAYLLDADEKEIRCSRTRAAPLSFEEKIDAYTFCAGYASRFSSNARRLRAATTLRFVSVIADFIEMPKSSQLTLAIAFSTMIAAR